MIITNKVDARALLLSGQLGNRLATWDDRERFMKEAPRDRLYTIRANKAWQKTKKLQTYMQVVDRWVTARGILVNEAAPDDHLTIQGEVWESPYGLELCYSAAIGLTMKEAMALPPDQLHRAHGLHARLLLRRALWPSSYADLEVLLDQLPGAVLEFSAYEIAVGDLPGRNTLVWEGRTTY